MVARKTERVILAIEPELKELMRKVSASQGIQVSDLVRMSVRNYLRSLGYKLDEE